MSKERNFTKVREDLTDREFGRWSVQSFVGKKGHNLFWKCICKCGKEKDLAQHSLISGKTLSCGCMQKEKLTLPRNQASINRVIRNYITSSTKKNLEFKLTREEIVTLISRNCYYCNCVPNQSTDRKGKYCKNGVLLYNGIDRIDNKIGYVIENCVTCCIMCNQAKSSYSQSYFIDWIKRVYENIYSNKEII